MGTLEEDWRKEKGSEGGRENWRAQQKSIEKKEWSEDNTEKNVFYVWAGLFHRKILSVKTFSLHPIPKPLPFVKVIKELLFKKYFSEVSYCNYYYYYYYYYTIMDFIMLLGLPFLPLPLGSITDYYISLVPVDKCHIVNPGKEPLGHER